MPLLILLFFFYFFFIHKFIHLFILFYANVLMINFLIISLHASSLYNKPLIFDLNHDFEIIFFFYLHFQVIIYLTFIFHIFYALHLLFNWFQFFSTKFILVLFYFQLFFFVLFFKVVQENQFYFKVNLFGLQFNQFYWFKLLHQQEDFYYLHLFQDFVSTLIIIKLNICYLEQHHKIIQKQLIFCSQIYIYQKMAKQSHKQQKKNKHKNRHPRHSSSQSRKKQKKEKNKKRNKQSSSSRSRSRSNKKKIYHSKQKKYVSPINQDWNKQKSKKQQQQIILEKKVQTEDVEILQNVPKQQKNNEIVSNQIQNQQITDDFLQSVMGFSSFSTSKGKDHTNSSCQYSIKNSQLKTKYRQYMNRRGGFNRNLDQVKQ